MNPLGKYSQQDTSSMSDINNDTNKDFASNINNINTTEKYTGEHQSNVIPGNLTQLSEYELPNEANSLICWLARLGVEKNHPRRLENDSQLKLHRSGEVLVLPKETKLATAFNTLVKEGYSSAPVIDNENKYMGCIDLLDITWFCVQKFGVWRTEERLDDESQYNTYWNRYVASQRFNEILVEDILNRPAWINRTAFTPLYRGFSTLYAMEFLFRTNSHRIEIINKENRILNILTQSMLISLFAQNLYRFPNIRLYKVHLIIPNLVTTLITCKDNDLVIDVFKTIVNNKIRGLPVLNDSNELVDNISIRDLRVIGNNANQFYRLWLTVKEFKRAAREEYGQQTPNKPIFVTKQESIEDVIMKMDDGNIHRVYVVETNSKGNPVPTHVITQRDLLRFIIHRIGLDPATIELANF